MSNNKRYRSWVFTWNNYPEDWSDIFLDNFEKDIKFLVAGREVGKLKGTRHIQGYISFISGRTFASIQKRIKGINWEQAKGNAKQNYDYCTKEDTDPLVIGDMPRAGARSDLIQIKKTLDETGQIRKLELESVQQIRFAELYLKYKEIKRTWAPNVYWFFGESGAGKTRWAFEMFPDAYVSAKNLKWWEGYDGHDDVIIDDFRGDFCTFHELLRILDRYEYRIKVKGASRQLLAKNLVITSCYHPADVYNTREDLWQLLRRIGEIIEFKCDGSLINHPIEMPKEITKDDLPTWTGVL